MLLCWSRLARWRRGCLIAIFWGYVMTQMPMSDQVFDFFPQMNVVISTMTVVFVELAVLGHIFLCWVRPHLRGPSQESLVLHLG